MKYSMLFWNTAHGRIGILKCLDTEHQTSVEADNLSDFFELVQRAIEAYERNQHVAVETSTDTTRD